ncbi:MAG: hypothetical protein DMG27_18155 [Acidobacteria bacterium]|nr:MAG: hypothetical protein DMG27_18155 [Acidobacteriota bacterium]
MKGERQQTSLLLGEDLGDGAGVIAGPGALLSDLVTPSQGLAVEVLQCGEGASGEEALADILNGALDAPFWHLSRILCLNG